MNRLHLRPVRHWPPSPEHCWCDQSDRSHCLKGSRSAKGASRPSSHLSSCPYLGLETEKRKKSESESRCRKSQKVSPGAEKPPSRLERPVLTSDGFQRVPSVLRGTERGLQSGGKRKRDPGLDVTRWERKMKAERQFPKRVWRVCGVCVACVCVCVWGTYVLGLN